MQLRIPLLLVLSILPTVAACGGKYTTYPVSGKVTFPDGEPVVGAEVIFQCREPALTASGVTDSSGHYQVGTTAANDGAPAGEYRVAVVEAEGDDPENPLPAKIAPRYGSFQTSGLTFTVGPDSGTFDIQVDSAEQASP